MSWKTISLGRTASAIVVALAALTATAPATPAAEARQEERKAAATAPPDSRRSSPPDKQSGTGAKKAAAKKSHGTAGMGSIPAPAADEGQAEAAIAKALKQTTAMQFTEETFANVIDYLKDFHRIEIQLDTKSLEEVGFASDKQITVNLKGISLRSALHLLLRPQGLVHTIHDQVLLITTPDALPSMMTVEVYEVADLVACRDEKGQAWDDYDTLVHLITSQVEPDSWSESGGAGAISAAALGTAKVLVVTHHSEVHRQIVDLLAQIRAIGAKSASEGRPPVRSRPQSLSPPAVGEAEGGKKTAVPRP